MNVLAHQMAQELQYGLDPVLFAQERLNFSPDDWQAEVMRSNARNIILNCSRQAGKSTTTAAIALHTALYCPRSLVLLVSPSMRQTRELFIKVTNFLKDLEPAPLREEDNKLSFELGNKSRVVSLPGNNADNIRGYSAPKLILVDEAAFVKDELFNAARPMLAVSKGRMIVMSTPAGKRGVFYDLWSKGGDHWSRVKAPADRCPRVDPELIENDRLTQGQDYVDQEYFCHFKDAVGQSFRTEDIERAISDDVKPLFPVDGPSIPALEL